MESQHPSQSASIILNHIQPDLIIAKRFFLLLPSAGRETLPAVQ